ncbi:MAG TPA: hypothetical protein VKB35_11890 [Ktedonobacteraceae bacterium]|nr:hypothetical protein [Ktedonobacteraceae bacterium]
MHRPGQPKSSTQSNNQVDEAPSRKAQTTSKRVSLSTSPGFDWLGLGIVILIAAFFAFTARLNAQPATSLVPVAVLSATGCGLLVTALRKLRTPQGVGLFAAALGGFFVALFQFLVALTYPGVPGTLSAGGPSSGPFLSTWGLVMGFSILFSAAGAVLGHLAFAPPRPLPPARPLPKDSPALSAGGEADDASLEEQAADHVELVEDHVLSSENEENAAGEGEQHSGEEAMQSLQPARSAFSYIVTILLLGLAPTVIAYVFSTAFDLTLSLNQVIPGPYPTLRLLSTLLPWQIPLPINVSGNIGNMIIFSLLWRIPLFLGNPKPFDLQALEPFVFNGAALALLLLTMDRHDTGTSRPSFSADWPVYLLLEAALGLVLILPADLWINQGLRGLLQLPSIVVPIRTLSILDPLTFSLNLLTGLLVCIAIGVSLRMLLNKRTRATRR